MALLGFLYCQLLASYNPRFLVVDVFLVIAMFGRLSFRTLTWYQFLANPWRCSIFKFPEVIRAYRTPRLIDW
jgi:hypothetical protein